MLASVVYVLLVVALFTALGVQRPRPGRDAADVPTVRGVLGTALAGLRRLQELHERASTDPARLR